MYKRLWAPILAASLVGCAAVPASTGPAAPRYHLAQIGGYGGYDTLNDDLVNVHALSQPGYGPDRPLGGGTDLEWASEGYQEPEAHYTMEFGHPHTFTAIDLKTGPTKGSYYIVWSSNDGYDWRPASDRIEAYDWDVNTYPLYGSGRFLQLRWYNTGYVDHAAVFALQVHGDGGAYGDRYADRGRWRHRHRH